MSWEAIDNLRPAAAASAKVPPDGVRVGVRAVGVKGGRTVRWIGITVGAALAKGLSLVQPEIRVRLLMGGGEDHGKLRLAVDATAGNFLARRQKSGAYLIAINAASAEGLFSLDFPAFARARLEAIRPQNGQPVFTVFAVDPAMLEADDD